MSHAIKTHSQHIQNAHAIICVWHLWHYNFPCHSAQAEWQAYIALNGHQVADNR